MGLDIRAPRAKGSPTPSCPLREGPKEAGTLSPRCHPDARDRFAAPGPTVPEQTPGLPVMRARLSARNPEDVTHPLV